jgi:hypothetical protein
METKKGIKTFEFWVTIVSTILVTLLSNFPSEAFIALMVWVVARSGQKFFGFADAAGNPSWKTTEFWVTIVYSLLVTVFPDVPQESLVAILGYTGARTVAKAVTVKNGK